MFHGTHSLNIAAVAVVVPPVEFEKKIEIDVLCISEFPVGDEQVLVT